MMFEPAPPDRGPTLNDIPLYMRGGVPWEIGTAAPPSMSTGDLLLEFQRCFDVLAWRGPETDEVRGKWVARFNSLSAEVVIR